MTKARDFADIAGAVSGGKIASSDVNVSFENITDTGTEGTKVAAGTTGQRGSTAGQWRYNTTTGKFEGRDSSGFKELDTAPTVSSVGATNITVAQITANYDLAITGTNFQSGATVKFIGNDGTEYASPTVTVNSATSISARVPTSVTNANEPFDVKVANSNNLSGTLVDAFNVDAAPVWQTAAGNIANNIYDDSASSTVHATVSATDPEGDTVAYSETGGTNLSGAGFSLNSGNGQITGDPNDVSSDTTVSFTLRATSGTNTTDRAFNVIVKQGILQSNLQAHYSFKSGDSYSGSGTAVTNLKTSTNIGDAVLSNSPVYDSSAGTMGFNITNVSQKQGLHIPDSAFPNTVTTLTTQILVDFTAANSTGRSYIVDWRKASPQTGDWYWLFDNNGNSSNELTLNAGGGERYGNAPASIPGYGYLIHTCKMDSGGNVQWRVHSTDGTSNTNWRNATSSSGQTLSNGEMFFMGISPNDSSSNYWARGYIKQILIYDDILTDSEADANAAVLGARY